MEYSQIFVEVLLNHKANKKKYNIINVVLIVQK